MAGGINLYAYAGSNPVAFSDPFGLCAEAAAPPDSILLSVTIRCPGPGVRTEKRTVWAHRVTDPTKLAKFERAVEKLTGGTTGYTPDAVRSSYAPVISDGALYSHPTHSADGYPIVTVGASRPGVLSLRDDVWNDLGSGVPLNQGTPSLCQIIGHEGMHHVQFSRGRGVGNLLNEHPDDVAKNPWRC